MPKTILVTGANLPLGSSVSETLALSGNRVFAAMPDPAIRHREQANSLWSRGIDVISLDVTDQASVDAAVRRVQDKAGAIDVLVNNAAMFAAGATEAFTAQDAATIFDVNIVGMLRATRAVLPSMRAEGGGLVINIGSVLGRVTLPFLGLYGATSFAIEALTDSLRYELAPFGLEATVIQPGTGFARENAEELIAGDGELGAAYAMSGHEPAVVLDKLCTRDEGSDPRAVANALVRLIDMPPGRRPPRLIVGDDLGAYSLNEAAEKAQALLAERLGLGFRSQGCGNGCG